jgi:cytochrome c-type biogenesis protein CcmH
MIFWIIIPLLTILAASFVAIPLWRAGQVSVSSSGSAAATRQNRTLWLVLGLAALVSIPAIALYALVGRPDLALTGSRMDAAARADAATGISPASSMSDMIAQLQEKVRRSPKDADSWQTLGWAFMHIRQPRDAAEAYKHAIALVPDNAEYRSGLAEALIQSGDGKISTDALAELKRVVAANPSDARARFYLALYKDQKGDHRGAVADWIALLKSAPAGAPWAPQVRRVVEQVAKEEKLDVAAQLPAIADGTADAPVPGPNAEQVAAAQQMSAGDRNTMIRAMVDRLAGELKQNPHDADGWVRLMRARMVLGEKAQALAAYRAARDTFGKDPAQLTVLESQARTLGITGG